MPPDRPADGAGHEPDSSAATTAGFAAVIADLRTELDNQRAHRPELTLENEPPPRRLAPQAVAVSGTVHLSDTEVGWGKFVLLGDPSGQEGWGGQFRVIAYVRSELEPEIASDPLIGEVGWSWLTEALESRQADYSAPSGTVTTVVTEGFGAKRDEPVTIGFELRASWSPAGLESAVGGSGVGRHLAAWSDLLCVASGLPPYAPGVAALPPGKRRHHP